MRAKRGDVRAAVLALLGERPMHGYEMIRELDERTNGLWKPSPGSVYPTLALLEDEALISSEEANGRKLFSLTQTGQELQAHLDATPWSAVADSADPARRALREAMGAALMAVKQVGEIGSDKQKAQAAELVGELRRKIYLMLAE